MERWEVLALEQAQDERDALRAQLAAADAVARKVFGDSPYIAGPIGLYCKHCGQLKTLLHAKDCPHMLSVAYVSTYTREVQK